MSVFVTLFVAYLNNRVARWTATYDNTGAVDYKDVFNNAVDAFSDLVIAAGARVQSNLVDLTARAGYSLIDQKPKTPHEKVSEYFIFDWEYSQTPEQSSLAASSWGNNFTYDVSQGGFSDDNLLSIDQRGFKYLIQAEAAEFLKPSQILLTARSKMDDPFFKNYILRLRLNVGRQLMPFFFLTQKLL
ncbi:hypothetical protein BC826DRAFT_1022194 [Russula brevipes]|nr:hypothetical protein BC826DRAFT_1022194 [Russula brevipes]